MNNEQHFPFNFDAIPEYMRGGLLAYVNYGHPVGDFLSAVIDGDLYRAVGHADSTNMKLIPVYAAWFYNCAPAGCWGKSREHEEWIKIGGVHGKNITASEQPGGQNNIYKLMDDSVFVTRGV